jgi:hypothetical protein
MRAWVTEGLGMFILLEVMWIVAKLEAWVRA